MSCSKVKPRSYGEAITVNMHQQLAKEECERKKKSNESQVKHQTDWLQSSKKEKSKTG